MIPAAFEYKKPSTLSEAISMLNEFGDDAKILAGGHSLIPMMKLRLATPKYLIDINGLSDLEYIREENGHLKIGALTREVALEQSDVVKSRYPILLDTTKMIADPQVRNLATVGGNLAHGDPANDHPATMIALKAQVIIQGASGERSVGAVDFFEGFLTTALQQGEVLKEIRIPTPQGMSGGAYEKLERKVGDYATAAVAAQLTIDGSGTCTSAGIGLTNVDIVPLRATRSEEALVGKQLENSLFDQAAQFAAEDCNPADDLRGDEAFKRSVVKVLTKRALIRALERARGGN